MNQYEHNAWREAFKQEHGYYPEEDPNLRAKGFTPEQAAAEHDQVRNWSQGLGAEPTRRDFEDYWRQRYGPPQSNYAPTSPTRPPRRPLPPGVRPERPAPEYLYKRDPSPAMRQGRYLSDFLSQYYSQYRR